MPKKLLVPVLPTERFYDAVIAAGDRIAEEGGHIVFVFTKVEPPPQFFEDADDGWPSHKEMSADSEPEGDVVELESWREGQIAALEDARALLYERGLTDANIDYVFADLEEGPAQAIADEAAGGGYDAVVLAKGYFIDLPGDDSLPQEVARAVREGAEVELIVS